MELSEILPNSSNLNNTNNYYYFFNESQTFFMNNNNENNTFNDSHINRTNRTFPSNDFISEYAQIVNVANFYDNLACNRTHIIVTNNREVLREMLDVGTRKFSAKMLYTFIHMFNYDDISDFNNMMVQFGVFNNS